MTKAEKAGIIVATLDRLYPEAGVPLARRDPYTHLVAVLLSAQCTDVRVNQVTPRLFARAHTPERMAELPVGEIEAIIRPCGLSRNKSRAISELSRILCEQHQGRVPESLEALEALPGIGHKSAQVIMAQDFGAATFPVDTHIHRLAYRWGLSNGRNVAQTEKDLKRLFPEDRWNKLHLQIIFFGREHCPARSHLLAACPLCRIVGRRSLLREEARKGRSAGGRGSGGSRRRS